MIWVITPPKRRFGKDGGQKIKCGFSKHFSRSWVLDLGYESLKTQSTIRISSFVHPSQIVFREHKVHEKATKRTIIVTRMPKLLLCYYRLFLSIVFDTTFDRGLKVRLFCSPRCSTDTHHLFIILWFVWVLMTQRAMEGSHARPFHTANP